VNKKNSLGNNTLQSNVIHQASIEFLSYLIENGGDIHNVNNQGVTPLEEAVRAFSLPALGVLLKHGARMNPREDEKEPSSLIEHRDAEGNTILHKIAASMEYGHCMKGLLALNVNENHRGALFMATNRNGDTPLHSAIR